MANFRPSRLFAPYALTALGLLGLLSGTACFPLPTIPLPWTRIPAPNDPRIIVVRPTTPTAKPSTSTSSTDFTPSTVPTPPLALGPLTPKIDRRYTYQVAGDRQEVRVYTLVGQGVDNFTFRLEVSGKASPPPAVTRTMGIANGVFWTEETPSPVTKPIDDYPSESLEVGAGTFDCRRVEAPDGSVAYFSDGVLVKLIVGSTTIALASVD